MSTPTSCRLKLFSKKIPVLMVEVSKEKSRFLSYHLGCWEAGKFRSFVPTGLVDKSIPGRVQRHRLNHLHSHLKKTARRTYQLYSQLGCEALMLMADKRILSQFEDFLHETLREEIISRIHSSPAAETRDRKSDVEAKGIEELSAYEPREELVSGLSQVIVACNSFMIRRLLARSSPRGIRLR
jgi:Bacterial archaeo-eukaryotic release factor family 10